MAASSSDQSGTCLRADDAVPPAAPPPRPPIIASALAKPRARSPSPGWHHRRRPSSARRSGVLNSSPSSASPRAASPGRLILASSLARPMARSLAQRLDLLLELHVLPLRRPASFTSRHVAAIDRRSIMRVDGVLPFFTSLSWPTAAVPAATCAGQSHIVSFAAGRSLSPPLPCALSSKRLRPCGPTSYLRLRRRNTAAVPGNSISANFASVATAFRAAGVALSALCLLGWTRQSGL